MSPQKWGLHWLLRATLGESGEPMVQTEWTAKKASQKAKETTSLREKKKKKRLFWGRASASQKLSMHLIPIRY